MSAALPIFATTPLGHCCKQEYALSQVGWLNKDEREETKIRGQLNFFFSLSGPVCCSASLNLGIVDQMGSLHLLNSYFLLS